MPIGAIESTEAKDIQFIKWEHFSSCIISILGETDLLWCFNETNELNKFVTTCDSDHNEGYSSCAFDMSPAGRGLFHGYLDTRTPKDGRIKKSGYCAIRSKRVRVSI